MAQQIADGSYSEEEIFKNQSLLLLEAADLIDSRIEQERDLGRKNENDQETEALVIFRVRSLTLFRDALRFLAREILVKDDQKHHFLLPTARTLMDIYGRFLHLLENCDTTEEKALTCVGYQLLSYKLLGEKVFDETMKVYEHLIANSSKSFPGSFNEISKGKLGALGFLFPPTSQVLTEEIMKKYTTYAFDIFGVKRTYEIYGQFSQLLHGNPYYYNETRHNERFWLVATAIITSAFFIELEDHYFFGKVLPKDYREWLKKVKHEKKAFSDLWQAKSIRGYN